MNLETVECTLCGNPTAMLGTKLCDRCWELQTRIRANPELARRILAELDEEKFWPEEGKEKDND